MTYFCSDFKDGSIISLKCKTSVCMLNHCEQTYSGFSCHLLTLISPSRGLLSHTAPSLPSQTNFLIFHLRSFRPNGFLSVIPPVPPSSLRQTPPRHRSLVKRVGISRLARAEKYCRLRRRPPYKRVIFLPALDRLTGRCIRGGGVGRGMQI